LILNGESVNVSASNRFSIVFSTFGFIEFRLDQINTQDDGILLQCVIEMPNATLISEGLALQVLERMSKSLVFHCALKKLI
jgi:hypothetical protein